MQPTSVLSARASIPETGSALAKCHGADPGTPAGGPRHSDASENTTDSQKPSITGHPRALSISEVLFSDELEQRLRLQRTSESRGVRTPVHDLAMVSVLLCTAVHSAIRGRVDEAG
jgi:hypothetical protein